MNSLKALATGALAAASVVVVLVLVVWLAILARRALPDDAGSGSLTAPERANAPAADSSSGPLAIADTLLGRSGRIRFVALTVAEAHAMPNLRRAFRDSTIPAPGTLTLTVERDSFHLFIMRPFAHKRGEYLGAYRLGWWPAERWMMAENYLNPDGFVEVQPMHMSARVSTHFRLADFLTRDGQTVWPKYVVLEERLIDKLELVLMELARRGIDATRAVVLSGFRAPWYNDMQVDEGAARASRHQFGDAADIIIDSDGDGRMDDLNGDRRSDLRDLLPIGSAVADVERNYPGLVGGLGTYAAMGPSGPFAHIDVRGTSARWERARSQRRDTTRRP